MNAYIACEVYQMSVRIHSHQRSQKEHRESVNKNDIVISALKLYIRRLLIRICDYGIGILGFPSVPVQRERKIRLKSDVFACHTHEIQ